MSCEQIQELFSAHVDDQLSPSDEDRLGAHVAECDRCRAALVLFETHLQALAGAAPLPRPALQARTLAAARHEGFVGQRRWLLPLAAGLAVFAGGYAVGRRGPAPAPAAWTLAALPAACSPDLLPRLDQEALRIPRPGPRERSVPAGGGRSVRVPASLLSHGPYNAQAARTLEAQGGACLPLTTAYGDALVLVVVPAPTRASAGSFVVEPDPRRVLYTRVRWVQAGMAFSLEGRAEAHELLELAQEIAGETRVEVGQSARGTAGERSAG
jgi:anti-sigma factor RsiW